MQRQLSVIVGSLLPSKAYQLRSTSLARAELTNLPEGTPAYVATGKAFLLSSLPAQLDRLQAVQSEVQGNLDSLIARKRQIEDQLGR